MFRAFLFTALFLFTAGPFLHAQNDFYKEGIYYDIYGRKLKGYFDTSRVIHSYFNFKDSLSVRMPRKVDMKYVRAFRIEKDSFVVMHNFKVESTVWAKRTKLIDIGVGRVVEVGQVNLYEVKFLSKTGKDPFNATVGSSYSGRTSKSTGVYVLRQRGIENATAIEMDIRDFVPQMEAYFSTSKEILDKIRNKEYSYLKAQQLVRDFNTWYAAKP